MADTRRILHCDMDCFYAAVHMREDPSLVGKPVVVGGDPTGRGVVSAASYEARKYGIHSAMPAARAVRLCPHAVFISPDFTLYTEASRQIFSIYRDFTESVQTLGLDEAYVDVTDIYESYGSATDVAKAIRARVREETQLTVSVGVGPNRLIAKIASDFDKPDGLTVVPPHQVEDFLAPLPVRRIPGVGPSTEKRLHALGLRTIKELREYDVDALSRHLGSRGSMLHEFGWGRDRRAVHTGSWERKSLSSEHTFREDLTDLEEIRERVTSLAERVALSIAKRELWAFTVTIKVRYDDFTTITRSQTLPSPTQRPQTVRDTALELLSRTQAGRRPVRLLGVGLHNLLDADDPAQLSLFEQAHIE